MPYKTGSWGIQAQERAQCRTEYFKEYYKRRPDKDRNSLGYEGEMIGLEVLSGSEKISNPCDINWNGKLVDVKTARPTESNGGSSLPRWKFFLSKQKNKIDLFLLICKDNDGAVVNMYLIPDVDIKNGNLSFNVETASKYSKYLLSL